MNAEQLRGLQAAAATMAEKVRAIEASGILRDYQAVAAEAAERAAVLDATGILNDYQAVVGTVAGQAAAFKASDILNDYQAVVGTVAGQAATLAASGILNDYQAVVGTVAGQAATLDATGLLNGCQAAMGRAAYAEAILSTATVRGPTLGSFMAGLASLAGRLRHDERARAMYEDVLRAVMLHVPGKTQAAHFAQKVGDLFWRARRSAESIFRWASTASRRAAHAPIAYSVMLVRDRGDAAAPRTEDTSASADSEDHLWPDLREASGLGVTPGLRFSSSVA